MNSRVPQCVSALERAGGEQQQEACGPAVKQRVDRHHRCGRYCHVVIGRDILEPGEVREGALAALDPNVSMKIEIASTAAQRIADAAEMVEAIVSKSTPTYGVNTGFGHFANVMIPRAKVVDLQYNIVRSHCCGVGRSLSRDLVLSMWLIGLHTICLGRSGVRRSTLDAIIQILERGVLALVPSRGSVGASGDLAPLAHAVRALLGEGRCTISDGSGFIELPAEQALRHVAATRVSLGPKEGLSLVNGTHLTTALAVKAWYEGRDLLKIANLSAAMSMAAVGASRSFLHTDLLRAHRHPGTLSCGRQLAAHLDVDTSEPATVTPNGWIQDPYSFRCAPQIHGAVWEEMQRAEDVLRDEINASTDNPLLFPESGNVLSGGNFQAIYVARVGDALSSALTTLASICERRISQIMDGKRYGLPTFLVGDGGVNSGFMMAQVTAAALVSECKSLSHPASVDSIPTNCDQEDHVSMGPIACYKALEIVEKLRYVLAIELLVAAQALDLAPGRRCPLNIARVHSRIRQLVPFLDTDRSLSEDIELIARQIELRRILIP